MPTQVYARRMKTLRELMAQSAARADIDFVVQGEDRMTFGENDRRARAVAASLAGLGIGVGDRVALLSANNPDWVVTFWACAVLGAVVVPLNAWWKAEELEFGLNDAEAKVLIADARRLAVIADRLPEIASIEHVFVFDDPLPGSAGASSARPFAELASGTGRASRGAPRRRRSPRDHLHVGNDGPSQGRDAYAPPGDRESFEHHRVGCRDRDARNAGSRDGGRAPVGVVARRAAVPRDRLPLDDDVELRDWCQGRVDAAGSLRPRCCDGAHRARTGHFHRGSADRHVADPRVAESREVRPVVGEAGELRRRSRPRPSSSSGSRRSSRTCARRSRPPTGSRRPRRSRRRMAATTTSRIPARSAGPRRPSSCASSTSTVTTRRRASAARCGSRGRRS